MEIEEIKKSYQRKQKLYRTKQDNLREEIEKAEAKVEELKEKDRKMNYPHFIDNYIKPLADELIKHFKCRTYDILGPFGLTNETAIHFYKKGVSKEKMFDVDNCISVDFRPAYKTFDLVVVNNLSDTKQYPEGSIGNLNGSNQTTLPMPKTIKALVKFIKKQNKVKN